MMTLNKLKLVESFTALDLAAGAIRKLYEMFLFVDDKRETSTMMAEVAAQMGVLIQIRLKVYSDELNIFSTYYKVKNIPLKQNIKTFRGLLKEYNVELVRNIILTHNRHKEKEMKITTAMDLEQLNMPSSKQDYCKLVTKLNGLHYYIFQSMIVIVPELKN